MNKPAREYTDIERAQAAIISLETACYRLHLLVESLIDTHPNYAALKDRILSSVDKQLECTSEESQARRRALAPDPQFEKTPLEKMAENSDILMLQELRKRF
jgi:hypothetical protein